MKNDLPLHVNTHKKTFTSHMPQDREFLHLDETEHLPGVSKYDVIEMIRTGKINAYAWIPELKLFAVAKFKQYEKRSTLGSFLYEGIVSYDTATAIEILDDNKTVSLTYVEISEPEKIHSWSSEAPNIKYPNDRYSNHLPHNKIPNFNFIACKEPRSVSDIATPHYEQMVQVAKVFNAEPDAISNSKELIAGTLEKFSTNIESGSINIKPNQFRFKKSEVILPSTQPIKSQKTYKKGISLLDELILEILDQNKNLSSGEIWNILKKDSKKEDILNREFDLNGVIDEIGNDCINWVDSNKNERNISRSSFKNKVSKLRKKTHEEL